MRCPRCKEDTVQEDKYQMVCTNEDCDWILIRVKKTKKGKMNDER